MGDALCMMFGNANFLSLLVLRKRLEKEKHRREEAEAERKRLEEEITLLREAQEREARGIIWNYACQTY